MSAIGEVGIELGAGDVRRSDARPGEDAYCQPSASNRIVFSVAQGYELWASTYDRDPNPLLALEQRTLQGLLPSLEGRDALDIGCGTGRWLERLLQAGVRSAAGIDLSAPMLTIARPKPDLRARLVRADCLALPFRPLSADLVICSFVIGHIPSLSTLAGELVHVTRPGADVYVTDIHPTAYANGWRAGFRHAAGSADIATCVHSFAGIRGSFAAQGLRLADFLEPRLGEPEMPIFARTDRAHMFRAAVKVPALLICHFTRLASIGDTP